MSGDVDMRAMIEQIRRLSRLPEEAAKDAGPIVEKAVSQAAAEGVSPAGEPWAPKKGGGRALAKAASAVKLAIVGAVIQIKLAFPYSIHNFGDGHAPKRQVLPGAGQLPAKFASAVLEGCQRAFNRLVGGGNG